MASIWDDPDVVTASDRVATPCSLLSLNDKLTVEQVSAMREALLKLHDTYHDMRKRSSVKAPDRQEMDRFIDRSYELGFVCCDGSDRMDDADKTPVSAFIRILEQHPNLVQSMTLREIRQVTHFLLRSERFGDGGAAYGSGILIQFSKSGLAVAIAERLR